MKQLSEYLELSETIVRRLVKDEEIPYNKIKGSYRFFLPSIREWLRSSTVNPGTNSTDDNANKRAEEIFASVN
ncbi:MAG: helix-turn-helix domain-containing protein [Ignavibacteriae bacterium]|nr:helix-turn-helix domain-containing protein [Ignavibacteriota bacterium]